MKRFKIAARSSNLGAFGHRGFVLIAANGEAWEVMRTDGSFPRWERGNVVTVPTRPGDDGPLHWPSVSVECPRKLPDAPPEVIRETWSLPTPDQTGEPDE
jgi:predicted RNA binding protein YcfA (HicA-like mRNA interferase family)